MNEADRQLSGQKLQSGGISAMTQEAGRQGAAAWNAVWSQSRQASWRSCRLSKDFKAEGKEG